MLPKLTSVAGENPYMSWAKILDCGNAPLTFLDNTVALRQLEKAHKVSDSVELNSQCPRVQVCGITLHRLLNPNTRLQAIIAWPKVISGRQAKAKEKSLVPRIITLGGDHTYVLSDQFLSKEYHPDSKPHLKMLSAACFLP